MSKIQLWSLTLPFKHIQYLKGLTYGPFSDLWQQGWGDVDLNGTARACPPLVWLEDKYEDEVSLCGCADEKIFHLCVSW